MWNLEIDSLIFERSIQMPVEVLHILFVQGTAGLAVECFEHIIQFDSSGLGSLGDDYYSFLDSDIASLK